jgi:hypothetical protein
LATALGALAAGTATRVLQTTVMTPVSSYRLAVVLYAALGVILARAVFPACRAPPKRPPSARKGRSKRRSPACRGLDRSRDVVVKVSALFALDSFGGGFVIQSFAAYWFYLQFGVNPGTLGAIFFWASYDLLLYRAFVSVRPP